MAQIKEWLNGQLITRAETQEEVNKRLNPPVVTVPYVTILERLPDAAAEAFIAWVDSQPPKQRELYKYGGIPSDNTGARGIITGRGLNPTEILRPR